MLEVESAEALRDYVGQTLGQSAWLTVDQPMIDGFAQATGDHQWIHVDVERARREAPGGKTIAHGYLTLSLLPRLSAEIYAIRRKTRGINYGVNKVRFLSVVPAGARVRLSSVLKAVEPASGGQRITVEATMEIENGDRPALVAETIVLVFE
ncbi:MAG TPA: MaoC family dehydratase [Stellaceae bacterium]|nr:MaoC family dehydratase [Stellaceae bacterium]